jgi:hypothetical protein
LGAASLAAGVAMLPARAAQPGAGELSTDEVRQILLDEAEPGGILVERATIKPFWFEKEVGDRPSPHWPADNVSFDYAHLAAVGSSQDTFELTTKVLEQLLAINGLARNTALPRMLFGLRGCMLASGGDHAGWARSHRVRATRPNHVELRCLLGVWDTAENSLAVFKASTVPTFDYVEKQVEGALRCNMLPTGLHQYKVGAHKGERQPGAFRQQTPLWVIRATKNPVYAANDPGIEWDDLDGDLAFDNIHAAMLSSQKRPPYFSSCGCQTVAGAYSNGVPTGAWAEFRRAAGLAHPPRFHAGSRAQTSDDNRPFEYVLLTGAEAQLAAAGMGSRLLALRFGASGAKVSELQARLAREGQEGLAPTGVFDWKTLGAVLRWQKAAKLAPTGLIAAEAANRLGLKWA